METILTPTTELEAVNTLISTISMTPVNSLDDDATADVVMAVNVLREVNREVQTEGWHFNSEDDYPLVRGLDGRIKLPSNIAQVDLPTNCNGYWRKDVVQRGQYLYDKKSHGYTFDADLRASVILLLPFEEIPEAARYFITIRAARRFQDRTVGAMERHKFTETDELQALGRFRNAEAETGDYSYADNHDVQATLRR